MINEEYLPQAKIKILYAIQGTGNGHICRAHEIVPILMEKANVDVLVSGIQSDVVLPFPVKYKFTGLSFIFGKKGGVDLLQTFRKSKLRQLLNEIQSLPVEEYDLVISDFEPVSSWACYYKNKPCIGLSHQAAVINKKGPQPKHRDPVGKSILKTYAPASVRYGFHFANYDDHIFTPVIRRKVREAIVNDAGHYTVYLPAYSDKKIISVLSECEGVRWEVFSKHFKHEVSTPNINVFPIDNDLFIASMASASGVLCGAGFETPAEALYMKKKLMVIPMKNQFEQHCNAAALKALGVPVLKSLKKKHIGLLSEWITHAEPVQVNYPDQTEEIIDQILNTHAAITPLAAQENDGQDPLREGLPYSVKKLKQLTLNRILSKIGN